MSEKKKKKHSLGTVIILSIILCLTISSSLISIVSFTVTKKELKNSAYASIYSLIDAVSLNIEEIIETYFSSLETISSVPHLKVESIGLEHKVKYLNEIKKGNTHFKNIIYIDSKGNSLNESGKIVNHSKESYFESYKANKRLIFDPVKKDNLMIIKCALPVKDYANKAIGMLMAEVDAKEITNLVAKLSIGNGNHPFVINMKTGTVIADIKYENVEKNGNVIKNTTGKMHDLLMEASKGKRKVDEVSFVGMGEMFMGFRPVGANTSWAIVCYAPQFDFLAGLNTILKSILISFVISIVISIVIGLLITKISITPLKTVDYAIQEIATGHADLSNRIRINTNDEIGSVVEGFNKFTEKLQNIVKEIKSSEENLSSAGENLNTTSKETNSSITEILTNINSVNEQVIKQASNVEETVGAVNEISSNIASLEKMITNQSAGVSQASAAVEQMIGNISSVNNSVEKMADSFSELLDNTKVGSKKQEDVNEKIKQIEAQSKILQEANQAIGNIAAQTNLLAMNAAIEAAHAGEAGKGFSVVADEIRKLSETSENQTKTIREELQKIKDSIANVVEASNESQLAFNLVSNKIIDTDQVIQQIKSAMEEQNVGSKQISEVLHVMNDSTIEVRTASTEMTEGNKVILNEIQQLQNLTSTIKDSVQEMVQSANKINDSGESLNEITEIVNSSIEQISSQIGQFKV